ncbi:MAG: DUF559 domain-containing protein [Actinobacteria bacterium]|nr:DUF559 domain-containing protein [Actinomycetota bacterium]
MSHESAGACYGICRFDRGYEVITRPGTGGRRRHGALLVFRSTSLDGDVARFSGLPVTTAARVLVDLAPGLSEQRLARAFRETIRLRRSTTRRIRDAAERHRGRPGTRLLAELATRYSAIPYVRTRSDAESRALELLQDAGRPTPLVNVTIGGEEADLVWLEEKVIVELDGPQFHRFAAEDARKAERWRNAGFAVRRISTEAVYGSPLELLDICPRTRR